MNFYFCERCGKRVTEHDLAEGQGRDKKLKGVFCAECAVGVLTVEMLPLSQAEAHRILEAAEPPKSSPESLAARKVSAHAATRHPAPDQQTGTNLDYRRRLNFALVAVAVASLFTLSVWLLRARPPRASNLPPWERTTETPKAGPLRPPAVSAGDSAKSRSLGASEPPPNPSAPITPLASKAPDSESVTGKPDPAHALPPADLGAALEKKALPPPSQIEARDSASAYERFAGAFFTLLARRDTQEAERRLKAAELDPELHPIRAELALDRQALAWLGDLERAKLDGAQKLNELEGFELRRKNGAVYRVGKRESFQVLSVDANRIEVGSKGLSMPIDLGDLHADTRAQLTDLGLPKDGSGMLRRAFADLLPAFTDGTAAFPALREGLERARKAGAAPEECDYLVRKLELAERNTREAAAAKAWKAAAQLREEKKWKLVEKSLAEFERLHSASQVFRSKAAEARTLREECQKELALSEGYGFDFKQPKGWARFMEIFEAQEAFRMEVLHDGTSAAFRRTNAEETGKFGSLHLQARNLKFGRNWDLRLKASLHIDLSDLEKRMSGRLACLAVRFLTPGEKANTYFTNHARFDFCLGSSYEGGYLWCRLAHSATDFWRKEIAGAGPFSGVQRKGEGPLPFKPLVKDGKMKSPGSADGIYRLALSMRNLNFKASVNGVDAAEYELTAEAASHIAASPVALFVYASNQLPRIDLEEFVFAPLPAADK